MMPAPHPAPAVEDVPSRLISAAQRLADAVDALRFAPPVAHVYNPLRYAWPSCEAYLRRYGAGRRRVVFLGMNPGPFGMMQTGVPFGEVAAVRDWMGIEAPVTPPGSEHPKRRIEGFACRRSEVSGRRLWGWAAGRFGSASAFFEECFVLNWCPLVFLEASGRNRTPEQLPAAELAPLQAACDEHLREAIDALRPQWAIGIGGFARKRLESALAGRAESPRIGQVLHPSPASPAANRGWSVAVDRTLDELGVFTSVGP
jgi:single-strand selective monofunctional uracil DNA glycosylase